MLPDFDENGCLPPGTHRATIEQVCERFSRPAHRGRLQISQQLQELFDFVRTFAVGLYINGSYITSQLAPHDVDILIILPDDFDFNSSDSFRIEQFKNQKKRGRNKLDIKWSSPGKPPGSVQGMISFWSTDRDNNPKGIIYVEITR